MDRETLIRRLRAAVALLLVVLYAAGLVAMLASKVQLALILWVISTLGGIGLLYWLHILKERQDAAAKAEAEAKAKES